jgi:hypothetical protein
LTSGECREPGADVLVVDEGVEGLPLGYRHVSGCGSGGMLGAALSPPAQLLGVGQAGERVDGQDCSRQRKLTVPCGSGRESPDTCLGLGREQGTCAAVAASGLGNALDLVHRAAGEVADVQELDDGTGRPTGGHR